MSSKKAENMWLNLGFNIAAPSLMLIKGKALFNYLNISIENVDIWIFVIALAFPILYGIYDLIDRKKLNVFSIIGLVNVCLTGGIGLLALSKTTMVVKETAVPLVLGIAVLATAMSKKPLAKMLMLNDSVIDVEKIEKALAEKNTQAEYDNALKISTYWLSASFMISAVLNFLLASYIFQSEAGTEAFNAEVGKMTALSFPVISLPTMLIFVFAMYKFFTSLTKYTGLGIEDIIIKKDK